MKIKVLYEDDGRIVSLSREPESARDDGTMPPPRSGVDPTAGQRVAIVALDSAFRDLRLSEIHQRFVILGDGRDVRLHERVKSRVAD